MKRNLLTLAAASTLVLASALDVPVAEAAVSPAEAAALQGGALTPIGAEKAGNKEGTIPAWTGGYSPKVPQTSGRRSDPYAGDKLLYSITAKTADQYADKLTPGVLALFKKYPQSYRVDVYPTHRPASMPQAFYDATFKSATATKLIRDTSGYYRLDNDNGGIPFPVPKDGAEAMFNNNLVYAPPIEMNASNYLLQADGRRVLVSTYTNLYAHYGTGETRTRDGNYLAVRSTTTNPPLRAGEQVISQNYTDPVRDTTWVYLSGQRRVRKLPNGCCDTPTPFSSGLISFDEVSLFFGSLHKFDWKLVGKKEMLVPYDSNGYVVPTKVDDVIGPTHLNPDHVRWELHRVWVVDAKLKDGQRHVMPHSTYYLDEDTWAAVLADRYDAQGQLAKTGYQLTMVLTDTANVYPFAFGWYDLLSGAAYISNVFNEQREQIEVLDTLSKSRLSPDAMAGESVR